MSFKKNSIKNKVIIVLIVFYFIGLSKKDKQLPDNKKIKNISSHVIKYKENSFDGTYLIERSEPISSYGFIDFYDFRNGVCRYQYHSTYNKMERIGTYRVRKGENNPHFFDVIWTDEPLRIKKEIYKTANSYKIRLNGNWYTNNDSFRNSFSSPR